MHELALTERLVGLAVDEARQGGYGSIEKIYLEIGALANVVKEAVEFCFEIAAKNTLAEGAKLEIEVVPGRAVCRECGKESEISDFLGSCRYCHSIGLQIVSGKDIFIKKMEVK